MTGQVVGRYHATPACQATAAKYFTPGMLLSATFIHPDRCGAQQERCDGDWSEVGV